MENSISSGTHYTTVSRLMRIDNVRPPERRLQGVGNVNAPKVSRHLSVRMGMFKKSKPILGENLDSHIFTRNRARMDYSLTLV